MAIIIPPNEFARDPGAENLLSMFRLLLEDIFSPEGEICKGLCGITGYRRFYDWIQSPIVREYFTNAYKNAQLITDNCAAIQAAGGLPPTHLLATSDEIPAFYRKTLTHSILNCHTGVVELHELAKELLEETKARKDSSGRGEIDIDEVCGRVSDGFTLSVTINRQLEPTLGHLVDRTLGNRGGV